MSNEKKPLNNKKSNLDDWQTHSYSSLNAIIDHRESEINSNLLDDDDINFKRSFSSRDFKSQHKQTLKLKNDDRRSSELQPINKDLYEEFELSSAHVKNSKNTTRIKLFDSIVHFYNKHSRLLSNLKVFILLIYCVSMIVIFSMNQEQEDNWSQMIITKQSSSRFVCNQKDHVAHINRQSAYFRLKLKGPYKDISDLPNFNRLNKKVIRIGLFNLNNELLDSWFLATTKHLNHSVGYSNVNLLKKDFNLARTYKKSQVYFDVSSNDIDTNSFQFDCIQLSQSFKYAIFFAVALLVFVYGLIIFELVRFCNFDHFKGFIC